MEILKRVEHKIIFYTLVVSDSLSIEYAVNGTSVSRNGVLLFSHYDLYSSHMEFLTSIGYTFSPLLRPCPNYLVNYRNIDIRYLRLSFISLLRSAFKIFKSHKSFDDFVLVYLRGLQPSLLSTFVHLSYSYRNLSGRSFSHDDYLSIDDALTKIKDIYSQPFINFSFHIS